MLMKKSLLLSMLCTLITILAHAQVHTPVITDKAPDTAKTKTSAPKNKLQYAYNSTMNAAHDITDNLAQAQDFQLFYTTLKAANMIETLKSRGPFTVFAPTDDAFRKLTAGKLDTLLKPANKVQLSNLVSSHIIAGKLSIKDISKQINSGDGQATLITLAGNKLIAKIDSNRNIVLTDDNGNQCVISVFDLQQNNGVIHVVNAVLEPKNKAI